MVTRIGAVGASGATGRELVKQALERGHSVVAVAMLDEAEQGQNAGGVVVPLP